MTTNKDLSEDDYEKEDNNQIDEAPIIIDVEAETGAQATTHQ